MIDHDDAAPAPAPDTAPCPTGAGGHLPDDLVDTLDRTFRRLRRVMIRPMAALVPVPALGRQLDFSKIFACDAVAELAAQGTVTVKDVAQYLDLEHSTVSRLLGEVEADGLLVRAPDPSDRRRTAVELTDLGRAVVRDATDVTRFFTRLLLAEWSREDVDDLQRLLGRLADTVSTRLEAVHGSALAELSAVRPELADAVAEVAQETRQRARRHP